MDTSVTRDSVQDKALEISKSHFRCGLGISMGVGKTRIALEHMKSFYNGFSTFLVVAPKKTIFKSWIDECEKTGYTHLLDHITFVTYVSLKKKNPNDYDIVYLDECHSLKYTHKKFLANFDGRILGLTGTPPSRISSEKGDMVSSFCPIVYKFSVDNAADNNILNDYKIYIHHLQLSKTRNLKKKNKKGGFWYTSEVLDYDYYSRRTITDQQTKSSKKGYMGRIMRMKSMMDYPTKEIYTKNLLKRYAGKDKKVIVFANTKEQADRMSSYSYHSSNPNSDDNLEYFSDGRINVLSCVLQLSEGVTIPDLQSGIILHAYGNNRKSAQRIGRLLRLNPDMTSNCHILCYADTIDKNWVMAAVKDFSMNKVYHVEVKNNQPFRVVKHGNNSNKIWPKFYKK
jgi:superfamily II DNA or RNA helicase|tara:strand:- start:172 stop:1365 length:1194 start_codon:yes stop_codon:yes gene_type:complete